MSNIVSSKSSESPISDCLFRGSYKVRDYMDTEIMYIEKITHIVVSVPIYFTSNNVEYRSV